MDLFRMEIAGTVFAVESLFETTKVYCRDYLTDAKPEFTVNVSRSDLLREQELLDIEADSEGLKRRKFPDPFLERSAIQRKVASILFEREILMLHGSTVAVDGDAYLFTAACGTGKSTHTRFWRDAFLDRAVMINDDKPFLRFENGAVYACGSPWTGKHGLGENLSVPLKGICILKRGLSNEIRRISPENARTMLLHQSFQPDENLHMVHSMVERLMEQVPLWEMICTKDPSAALVSYEAMSNV